MATEAAKNLIVKDSLINNTNLLALTNASETALHSHAAGGGGYTSRGDPNAWDKQVGDFTTNGAWHDLDLSSIVSAGAKLIYVWVRLRDDLINAEINFRKNGNSNAFNSPKVHVNIVNIYTHDKIWIECDTDRIIEYLATNTTFDTIDFVVMGWM